MLINFTNHPSSRWEEEQKAAAKQYGEIVDLPFPAVDAGEDERYIQELAEKYVGLIRQLNPAAVLCQGEFCLTYQVTAMLKEGGITVLAACSERSIKERGNGKELEFVFRRFRKY